MIIFHDSRDKDYRAPFGAAETGSEISLSIDAYDQVPESVRLILWHGDDPDPQYIDMKEKGMSRGEFNSVKQAVGGADALIDDNCRDKELVTLLKYLSDEDKEEKIYEEQHVIRTPIVRNGKYAVIGYCPDVWKEWE